MPGEMKGFVARDGTKIFYREWKGSAEKDVIVYLHGFESHTGWFVDTANLLNQRDFTIYALERRGSGVNQADRGHVKNYRILVDDLKMALQLVKEENPGKRVYLMGLCWGGKLAVTFAALKNGLIDGLILVTPAIKTRVDLSPRQKIDVLFSNFFRPRKLFDIPIEDSMFTKNPKYLSFIKNDNLKLTRATARFFFETAKMDMRLGRLAGDIDIPVLMLLARDDRVVNNAEVKNWFDRVASKDKSLKAYEGTCHAIEFEGEATGLAEDICKWINERKS